MKPNLFKTATGELSQDGFLVWLIQWADESLRGLNEALVDCAQAFVLYLISLRLPAYGKRIAKIEAGRQWENIDVWAEINDDIFIIIEDKTFTGEHSKQLERYMTEAKEYCGETCRELVCVYLKTFPTGAAETLKTIQEKGFAVVDRDKLLEILRPHKERIKSDIFNDFVEKLEDDREHENRFRVRPIGEWRGDGNVWRGFYRCLETQIDIVDRGGWKYVPNPNGGFWGMWWAFRAWNDVLVYLQIEQGKLCFKMGEVYENHSEIRAAWQNIIMSEAKKENRQEIAKPKRLGSGTYMTVAAVEQKDWLGPDDATVDVDAVVAKLKEYERFLERCAAAGGSEESKS